MKAGRVERLLEEHDEFKNDGRVSDFKNILPIDGRVYVFVRGCERPDAILLGREVVHGHRPEWIVLVFFDGAKRVNISSLSVGDSLAIANRIASGYYGKACEYDNEVVITYANQISVLLEKLRTSEDPVLTWVELLVGNTPLDGACGMKLSDPRSKSIGKTVSHFEKRVGRVLRTIENIESIKVCFREKRISLLFEPTEGADGGFVVHGNRRSADREVR